MNLRWESRKKEKNLTAKNAEIFETAKTQRKDYGFRFVVGKYFLRVTDRFPR
jgi:hypothetical protein